MRSLIETDTGFVAVGVIEKITFPTHDHNDFARIKDRDGEWHKTVIDRDGMHRLVAPVIPATPGTVLYWLIGAETDTKPEDVSCEIHPIIGWRVVYEDFAEPIIPGTGFQDMAMDNCSLLYERPDGKWQSLEYSGSWYDSLDDAKAELIQRCAYIQQRRLSRG